MATIQAGSYFIFNNEINLDSSLGIVLSVKYTVFTASGGQTSNFMYYTNGGLRTSISTGNTDLFYNVSVQGETLGWVYPFITTQMYIKSGSYTFDNQNAYSSFTQFQFVQVANFVVGDTLDVYGILVEPFKVGYRTSFSEPNYVYPYNYNSYNSEYYKLTFNSDTNVTKECAVWFAYIALYNNQQLNALDVLLESAPPTPQGYTITFNSNGGSSVSPQTNVTTIEELPIPTRQGYSFNGWYYDSLFTSRAVVGDTISSDITLYASWSLLTYTISFIVNNLIASPIDPIYNATSLPTPLPTPQIISPLYIFDGWFYDSGYSNRAYGGTEIYSNTVLYAKFSLQTYDISFVTNGGTNVDTISGVSNLPSPLPTTTREGYDFVGWYYDESFISIANAGDVLQSNVTLYAKWVIIDSEDFTLNCYKFSGEDIMIDKTRYLNLIGSYSGVARDEIDILNPIITIELNEFPRFNYVYINAFNRYYYVTNVVCVRKNLYEIALSIDVLMSYKEGLLSLDAFIDRNEFTYNSDIVDNQWVIEQGTKKKTKKISPAIFRTTARVAIVGTDLGGEDI